MYIVTAKTWERITDYYGDSRMNCEVQPLFVVETELEAGWWVDKLNYTYSCEDTIMEIGRFFDYSPIGNSFNQDIHIKLTNEACRIDPDYRFMG